MSTTFSLQHDLFPKPYICEKKCLQISILQGIVPLTLLKIVQNQASQAFFSPPVKGVMLSLKLSLA
jgi:hypothetical protein